MGYYSFTNPAGMEGRVTKFRWPLADSLSQKWSPTNHRSGAGQKKSAGQ